MSKKHTSPNKVFDLIVKNYINNHTYSKVYLYDKDGCEVRKIRNGQVGIRSHEDFKTFSIR